MIKNGMVTYEKLEDGIEKWYTYDNMGRVTDTRVKKGSDMDETIHTSYRYQDIQVYQGKGSDTVPVKNAYITREEYPDGSINFPEIGSIVSALALPMIWETLHSGIPERERSPLTSPKGMGEN